MRRSASCALVAAVLALALPAFPQTLPQGVQKVASIEGITEYAFPNGLHVLLIPDASKPKVAITISYRVGSRHDHLEDRAPRSRSAVSPVCGEGFLEEHSSRSLARNTGFRRDIVPAVL